MWSRMGNFWTLSTSLEGRACLPLLPQQHQATQGPSLTQCPHQKDKTEPCYGWNCIPLKFACGSPTPGAVVLEMGSVADS